MTLDDLSLLGPIFVLKLRMDPPELGRRIVAEMWLYPDGSRVLELSTRCGTGEAFQVAAEMRAYLARHGLDLSGEQTTKTRHALEYFASTLNRMTVKARWEWRAFGDGVGVGRRAPGLADARSGRGQR